jgi:hypothetical protein
MKKLLLATVLILAGLGSANAAERTIACRGKSIDVSESTFRVGKCVFASEEYPDIARTCSRPCLIRARVDGYNQVREILG